MTIEELDAQQRIASASIRERMLLGEFKLKQNDFTIISTTPIHSNAEYDAIIQSGDTYHVEIKIRNYNLFDFPSVIIYKDKWTKLIKLENPLYINIYNDGAWCFKLNDCKEPDWYDTQSDNTTYGDNIKKVSKIEGVLQHTEGTFYRGNYPIVEALTLSKQYYLKKYC